MGISADKINFLVIKLTYRHFEASSDQLQEDDIFKLRPEISAISSQNNIP